MMPRRLRLGSLTVRVIAFSTLWALLTLVIIATVISTLFRQASERGFESLLSAHLFNLISTVSVTEDGWLQGNPNLGDLRFTIPRSGWYWSVEPISDGLRGSLQSISMVEPIEAPTPEEVPFDSEFQRRYATMGVDDEFVDVICVAGRNAFDVTVAHDHESVRTQESSTRAQLGVVHEHEEKLPVALKPAELRHDRRERHKHVNAFFELIQRRLERRNDARKCISDCRSVEIRQVVLR